MKVSMVIPCIPTHFNKNAIYNALESILNGTEKPDEIIVVLSGVNQIKKSTIDEFQQYWKSIFPCMVLLQFPNIQTCGLNRQIGSSHAAHKIVIHADADDTYHPQRVEIIKHTFNSTDAMVINHLYVPESMAFKAYDIDKIKLAAGFDTLHDYYFPGGKLKILPLGEYYGSFLGLTTTDGHLSFRKSILADVCFPDQNSGCETKFLHFACYKFKKNIFLHACLSKYSKGDYWINRFPKELKPRLKKTLDGEIDSIFQPASTQNRTSLK